MRLVLVAIALSLVAAPVGVSYGGVCKKEEAVAKIVCPKSVKIKPAPPPTVKKPKTAVVKKPVTVPPPPPQSCCDKGTNRNGNVNQPKQNQKVLIKIVQPAAPKERVRVRYVERWRTKRLPVRVLNRLQLLVGYSKTDLVVNSDDCCEVSAENKREIDVGLQYLRDFGQFTGSVMGTMNGSFYVGVGVNW
jgi:hypothetical protein